MVQDNEFRAIYGQCRDLALSYGYVRESDRANYLDAFSCDFQIEYSQKLSDLKGGADTLMVYLGGRKVYEYDDMANKFWASENRDWLDLLNEIEMIEACNSKNEAYNMNTSIIEFFKREAVRNRTFLTEYAKIGMSIAKKAGEFRHDTPGVFEYKYAAEINEHKFVVYYNRDPLNSSVNIYYAKKSVFFYSWNALGDGYYDSKGYFNDGEWQNYLFDLYMALPEIEDRQL